MQLLSLDVLRGIAVLLVIVRHSDAAWNTWLTPIRRGGFLWLRERLTPARAAVLA